MKKIFIIVVCIVNILAISSCVSSYKLQAANNYIRVLEEELNQKSDNYILDVMSGTDEYVEYYQ